MQICSKTNKCIVGQVKSIRIVGAKDIGESVLMLL